ncbi:biliverdin-producing heme oxygenase [Caenimonas sp. SL110]|uniref:biliverdin-producing heme oxygenase n=1 Tax=Caenimonas sp. SL110 TaxID=1450524 RepID=UPI00069FE601|nr:biliverdin-producing heme oxygenase [Caenimonas sp. SL110]
MIEALRSATARSHDRIESVLQLEGDFSLAHYGAVLQGFAAFLDTWEPGVSNALPPHLKPWFAARTRGDMVRRDLVSLQLARPAPARLEIDLASPAAVFGSLYVLEGSALGGQVISRRLLEVHGFTPDHGAAYFNGHGAQTGRMWREFRQRLDAEVDDCDANRAIASAVAIQTFDALTGVFIEALTPYPL